MNLLTIKLKGNKWEGWNGNKKYGDSLPSNSSRKNNIEFFMVFLEIDLTNYKTLIISPLPHRLQEACTDVHPYNTN